MSRIETFLRHDAELDAFGYFQRIFKVNPEKGRAQTHNYTCHRGAPMKNHIQVNPTIHFGKPCVWGTRITVQNVLALVLEGIPFEVIIRDYYPDLTVEDLKACTASQTWPASS